MSAPVSCLKCGSLAGPAVCSEHGPTVQVYVSHEPAVLFHSHHSEMLCELIRELYFVRGTTVEMPEGAPP
jgi:hypothetical protein